MKTISTNSKTMALATKKRVRTTKQGVLQPKNKHLHENKIHRQRNNSLDNEKPSIYSTTMALTVIQ